MGEPTFGSPERPGEPGPVIRDQRRLDPETGQWHEAANGSASADTASTDQSGETGSGDAGSAATAPASPDREASTDAYPAGTSPAGSFPTGGSPTGSNPPAEAVTLDGILADLDVAQASAAERLSDLQRLQAEFLNYRRRVDRDRDVARDQAVAGVLEALLPVLDDVHLARQHGDLTGGPFAAIAEKLDAVLGRLGLVSYGEPGEAFDPAVHEALMNTEAELAEGTTTTTVVQVLQPGYRAGDRVLRPARVAVADPH